MLVQVERGDDSAFAFGRRYVMQRKKKKRKKEKEKEKEMGKETEAAGTEGGKGEISEKTRSVKGKKTKNEKLRRKRFLETG